MRLKGNQYTKAELIRIIREWTELSQEEFGRPIGKKARTIRAYEAGERSYSIDTFLDILKAYDISLELFKD